MARGLWAMMTKQENSGTRWQQWHKRTALVIVSRPVRGGRSLNSKGKGSTRSGSEKAVFVLGPSSSFVDMLLIRASPYRPAAVSTAATRGLIHDCNRSHAQAVQKTLEPTRASIHAQIECMRFFPLLQTDLGYDLSDRFAKRSIAIEYGDTDLDFRNLPFEVPCHEMWPLI